MAPNPKPKLSTTPNTPLDLIFSILLHLPPKDLIRSVCVCKSWNAIIHSQRFIDAHLQRSIQTNSFRTLLIKSSYAGKDWGRGFFATPFYDNDTIGSRAVKIDQPLKRQGKETHIVGYSHGLICIHNSDQDLALWNPSIHRFIKIPFTPFEIKNQRLGHAEYGFGYDSTNDDYKLVRILKCRDSTEVNVYSLKCNSWKRFQNPPSNFSGDRHDVQCLNGALHWLLERDFDMVRFRIIALNLSSEKYGEFQIPVGVNDNPPLGLEVLRGCLCIVVNHQMTRNDVWIMKEYGITKSWEMLYSIEQGAVPWMFEYCTPLVFSKSDQMVLLENDFERLFWYDIEKKRGKPVKIRDMPHCFTITICVGNLRLLDGDPVIFQRQQQVPSTSKKRKVSSSEGFLDLLVKAMEEDQT